MALRESSQVSWFVLWVWGWLCASAALANGIEDVAALPFWATGTSFGEIDVRSSVTNCGSG